ncbi:hypothetical protein FE257_000800 [Aspergillus nanangensis]|uniref:Uncharacterized protein n=1 Tax=Aspergillus nanangensis TaxID=2582783 RepID=A0AAD4CEN5_ASPNN|nr:hypothetical protein FE257_000800 [Aspergillus nanangensis]
MDVLAAAQMATEMAGLFLTIVEKTKELIETMKGAREALMELLSRSERVRLNLELFRALSRQLVDLHGKAMAVAFNGAAYSQTGNEVLTLVHKVADSSKHSDLWMKINWVYYKGDAEALVKKLEAREQDLGFVLTFIAAQSSVVTENEILAMKARAETGARVTSAFDDTEESLHPTAGDSSQSHGKESKCRQQAIWLGYLAREHTDPTYLKERQKLSEAAKWGRWDQVSSSLKTGSTQFHENWCNATKIGTAGKTRDLSLWTPLHQAAYTHAPRKVIEDLIQRGAYRTVPANTRGEFRHSDMTPVDIARDLGYRDICDILTPVIRHYIAPRTLTKLENHFHDLLRHELKGCSLLNDLRLPQLVALTELEYPEMWFPIRCLKRGFLFRLDDRDVVVLSTGRPKDPRRQLFRVTTTKWTRIHDAIVLGQ